jgi:hypothetical protein
VTAGRFSGAGGSDGIGAAASIFDWMPGRAAWIVAGAGAWIAADGSASGFGGWDAVAGIAAGFAGAGAAATAAGFSGLADAAASVFAGPGPSDFSGVRTSGAIGTPLPAAAAAAIAAPRPPWPVARAGPAQPAATMPPVKAIAATCNPFRDNGMTDTPQPVLGVYAFLMLHRAVSEKGE